MQNLSLSSKIIFQWFIVVTRKHTKNFLGAGANNEIFHKLENNQYFCFFALFPVLGFLHFYTSYPIFKNIYGQGSLRVQ